MSGEDVEPDVCHPYSPAETEKLFEVWVATSEDSVVGTQQTRMIFWDKISVTYKANKLEGTPRRTTKMLRDHFDQVSPGIQMFHDIFNNEERRCGSGMSEADILKSVLKIYHQDNRRFFKYVTTWAKVRHIDKWAGDIQLSSSSKRTKYTAEDNYSSSGEDQSKPGEEASGPGAGVSGVNFQKC